MNRYFLAVAVFSFGMGIVSSAHFATHPGSMVLFWAISTFGIASICIYLGFEE